MRRRLSERQQAVAFVAALLVVVLTLYAYIQVTQPARVSQKGTLSLTLTVDGETWRLEYGPVETVNNTVFVFLLEARHRFGFDVRWIDYEIPKGVFITAINGTTNGHGGKYWQYWVDGRYGDVAADRKELFDGDVVLWKFDVPQEGG